MVQTVRGVTFGNQQVFPKESSEFLCNSYFLMQTDEHLAKLIEDGDSIVIKGNDSEDAVLCTANETFSIRRAETSNLMMTINREMEYLNEYEASPAFLGSNGLGSIENGNSIIHSTYTFLEVIKKKPDLFQIIHSLDVLKVETDWKSSTMDSDSLFKDLQASEFEIRQYLESINAVQVNGKWWLLDLQYFKHVLELVVLTDIEMDMQNQLEFSAIKIALADHNIPESVLLHCLSTHAFARKETGAFELCLQKVSKTIGHALLSQAVSVINNRIRRSSRASFWMNGRDNVQWRLMWTLGSSKDIIFWMETK